MLDFSLKDVVEEIQGSEWEEKPVDLEEFIYSPEYLDLGGIKLSPIQLKIAQASTQILKKETLIELYG